jgi:hypothetical protein
MKALCASFLTVLFALLPVVASPADTDKTLQNVKGSVTYGAGTPTKTLGVKSSTTLNDQDSAATGADSLATITLPDSSQIVMASNSSVRVDQFNMSDIAHAKFTVIGKMRFTVNHPQGAKADYTFSTATGQIAVRGTVGDISANPTGLQVNVYAVSNPALPVQVTLANGQVFSLAAGQSLVATAAAGAVTASVTAVSQSMFTPFSELGAPANAGSLGIAGSTSAAAGGAAAGAATGATTAIAAGAVAAAAVTTTIVNNNSTTPSPAPTTAPTATPSPTPQPSTTSVPITVQSAAPRIPGRPGARPTPGAN